MKNKKKIIVIVILIAALVGIGIFLWKKGIFSANSENAVYVEKVSTISGIQLGAANRYMGVVEAGQIEKINNNSGQEIGEIYVKEGDTVTAGTALFSYDTAEYQQELERAQLEITSYDSQIARYQAQIAELDAERNTVSEDAKLEYTLEIQSIQLSIEEANSGKQSAQQDVAEAQKKIAESVVACKSDGIVKSINNSGEENYGDSAPFITILSEGNYRVKAVVNEQNISSITPEQKVKLRSRVDDTVWTGTVVSVDTENPVSNHASDDYYMEDSAGENASSQYNFYVNLDDATGLMIGQHLYVEPDFGKKSEGIWLNNGYVFYEEEQAYVWKANKYDKIEKKKVTVGEYDEETDEIQILDGLSASDEIAYPSGDIHEGISVARMEDIEDEPNENMPEDEYIPEENMPEDVDIPDEENMPEDVDIPDENYVEPEEQ